jgi:long-subunit fatty acid transport protein
MAVFIEKSPVTSSNCYNTIKTALTLITLGTNVSWTITLATTGLGLNFLLPWQRGDISKLPKNHYFALIFFIKIDFKVLQILNGLR